MKPYRVLYQLIKSHSVVYGTVFITVVVATACYLLLPLQLGKFFDALSAVSKGGNGSGAVRAISLSGALLALNAVVNLVQGTLIQFTSEKIINHLRARFFSHILRQPLGGGERRPLGRIASEFNSDLGIVQDGISAKFVDFFRNVIFTVGALVAVFYIDFRMTLFSLVAILLVAGVVLAFMKAVTKAILAVQEQRAELVSVLIESASNAYVIQAFGRIHFMESRFGEQLQLTFRRIRKHALLSGAMNPICLLVFASVAVVAVAYGVEELRLGRMRVASLVSYFTYALMLMSSVTQVSFLGGQLRQAGSVLLKHEALLQPLPDLRPELQVSSGVEGSVGLQVHGVTFSYAGSEGPALRNVSFTIPPRMVTGISGESGSGKTTLAGVIAGLIQPQTGSVEVQLDGVSVPLAKRLNLMAIVPQEPFLFRGTFYENITFGREGISSEDVTQAARAARIHDFILQRPGGYEARVEEAGGNLSRGQRQRIAIARALAGGPSLLLLDEATSSLDLASERAIRAIVEELKGRITIVVISHQGELLKTLDRRIVLDRGEVTYEGVDDPLPESAALSESVSSVLTMEV